MVTILRIAGLIFEQFGSLLTDEFFWIIILIIIMLYRRNAGMEIRMLGSSYSLVSKVFGSVLVGFAGGLLGSLLVLLVGISIEDYTSTGAGSLTTGITYIWILAIALSMINPRYLCFSYAGGIVALMNLMFGFPSVNVSGLMALIGVLHLIESFLIWLDGYTYSVPLFLRRRKGDTMGGYVMNKIWPIPLVIFAVMFGGSGGNVSFEGIIDMPSWWPLLKHSAAGGIRELVYVPLLVPVVLGYGDMAITKRPDKKCRSSAARLACYSLVLMVLSVISSEIRIFAYIAAVFAPIAHEMLIIYGVREEEEGEPYFSHKGQGLKVLYVQKDSPAAAMKIEPGDEIQRINGMAVHNEVQLAEFLRSYPVFLWLDIKKASGSMITAEHSNYRNGIGSLGALIVSQYMDFYYDVNSGSSLIKRMIEKLKGKRNRNIGM